MLEEVGSGEINVVSLPCETVLYSTDDTVKMVFDFTSPHELLVAMNDNYDLVISDYVTNFNQRFAVRGSTSIGIQIGFRQNLYK